MKKFIILLSFLLIPSFVFGTMIIHRSGDDYSDITFWWRVEQTDADFSGTNGTDDYSAGDDTGSLQGDAAINTDANSHGTYGLDFPNGSDYVAFTTSLDSIIDADNASGEFRIGFNVYLTSWGNNAPLFSIGDGSGTNYMILKLTDTDDLLITVETDAGGYDTEASSAAGLGTGTWYYIEIAYRSSDNTMEVYANGSRIINASDTISEFDSSLTYMWFGVNTAFGIDVYMDQIFISDDITRDLNALKAITSYPG